MKYSKDTFGNRTRSHQACSTMPQSTAPLADFKITRGEQKVDHQHDQKLVQLRNCLRARADSFTVC